MRILVVEDEKKLAAFVRKGLVEQSHSVDIAADGLEGHLLARQNDYDLIILDIILPRQDGWMTCKKIREDGISTPILMLTALGETNDKVRGLDSGAGAQMQQPLAIAVIGGFTVSAILLLFLLPLFFVLLLGQGKIGEDLG